MKTADEVDEPRNRRVDYILSIDEPAFIRRVSMAILEESVANTSDPSAQLDALSALANGGDIRARAQLSANQRKGSIAEVRVLAAARAS